MSEVTATVERARQKIDWPIALTLLPSQFGVLAEDVGIAETDIQRVAELAEGGDPESREKANVLCELVKELMARDTEMRQKIDNRGRKLYLDHEGRPTIAHYSQTLRNEDGSPLEHLPSREKRSRWGVRAGPETASAPGSNMPEVAYWRNKVNENFYDLMRQIKFLSPNPDLSYVRPELLESHKRKIAEVVSNDSLIRRNLLKWLKPFMENPVCKWNGED